MTKVAALIVAAGRGTRVAGAERPKQYLAVGNVPLLSYTLEPFLEHQMVQQVLVVTRREDLALYHAAIGAAGRIGSKLAPRKILPPAFGGASRQASVLSGLLALMPHKPDFVLVHDAARPFIDGSLITRVLDKLRTARAAIAAIPLADTLKRADFAGLIEATIPRDRLWRAQTPQAFRFEEILEAHRAAEKAGRDDFTDDAQIAEWAGLPVALVEATVNNIKITTTEDVAMAERRLVGPPLPDVRTGQGYDVHRFTAGGRLWLCGIEIAHDKGLEGHSDADVALHALTDALLGAIADHDIGHHFKNTDPRWKNAPSHKFLVDAVRRVERRGGLITNADVTIMCEEPKIAPHRDVMRRRIADILEIEVDRVSVKATTTEGLGFTGRREGIAAMATATVVFSGSP